jgi:hypothetical protein
MKRNVALKASGLLTMAFTLVVALWAAIAQAQPLITCNQGGLNGSTPINTYDFTSGALVGSFVPTGAFDLNDGRGVEVIGNKVYYTELTDQEGPTDFIRIAPFNGGAGGADIGTLPNPRPGFGIQDVAFRNGVLYVMTGYPSDPLEVFGLNPFTGAVVKGPISISAPAASDSDGFNILPNGNFLINEGDDVPVYDQYNPSTGAVIPGTTINVPGAEGATGVEIDGTSLIFQTNFDSFTQTTFAGTFIANQSVGFDQCEDISLELPGCFGAPGATPGTGGCHGACVSFLASTDGGMKKASSDLGYASVDALQDAIKAFCGK